MKKAPIILVVAVILWLIAFFVVNNIDQEQGLIIGNTTIVRPATVADVNTAVDEATADADDLAEEVEDVIQWIIDDVEQEIADGAEAVEDAEEALDEATDTDEDTVAEGEEDAMADEDSSDTNVDEESMDDSEDTNEDEVVVVIENEWYVEYDADVVQAATAAGKDVVLFFHAWRCPSCISLDDNVNENIGAIDENTVLVKVDYDNSEELKAQYGVTAQHTLVYLDENGDEKMKERGSMTLAEVQANIDG